MPYSEMHSNFYHNRHFVICKEFKNIHTHILKSKRILNSMRIGNGMISYKTTTKLFFQDNTIRWQYFTSKPFLILLNLFQSTKVY